MAIVIFPCGRKVKFSLDSALLESFIEEFGEETPFPSQFPYNKFFELTEYSYDCRFTVKFKDVCECLKFFDWLDSKERRFLWYRIYSEKFEMKYLLRNEVTCQYFLLEEYFSTIKNDFLEFERCACYSEMITIVKFLLSERTEKYISAGISITGISIGLILSDKNDFIFSYISTFDKNEKYEQKYSIKLFSCFVSQYKLLEKSFKLIFYNFLMRLFSNLRFCGNGDIFFIHCEIRWGGIGIISSLNEAEKYPELRELMHSILNVNWGIQLNYYYDERLDANYGMSEEDDFEIVIEKKNIDLIRDASSKFKRKVLLSPIFFLEAKECYFYISGDETKRKFVLEREIPYLVDIIEVSENDD